jgi:hypothetical protein
VANSASEEADETTRLESGALDGGFYEDGVLTQLEKPVGGGDRGIPFFFGFCSPVTQCRLSGVLHRLLDQRSSSSPLVLPLNIPGLLVSFPSDALLLLFFTALHFYLLRARTILGEYSLSRHFSSRQGRRRPFYFFYFQYRNPDSLMSFPCGDPQRKCGYFSLQVGSSCHSRRRKSRRTNQEGLLLNFPQEGRGPNSVLRGRREALFIPICIFWPEHLLPREGGTPAPPPLT